MSEEIQNKMERILLRVQKPGRYVGGELNQVIKQWDAVDTHVALIFPDIYDIGVPNLGISIFYEGLNKHNDIWAERAYAPWEDMEALMREQDIPLFSLESKNALIDFDILGITIPYESLYTNVLNILDLAKIPKYSAERTVEHPLILAGGHAMFNPEPMAPFLDAILIGEGDEAFEEIVDCYQAWKKKNTSRKQLLDELSKISGVYIPSQYGVEYHPDGTVDRVYPLDSSYPSVIKKRIAPRLPSPPTHFIVPSIDVIHNRVPVEIMRGCTRGCRFCHAGMINRPVRERPVEEIVTAIKQAVENTGYEEVGLLSLSSSDYTRINELVDQIKAFFCNKNLSVSLPSLRIESLSVDILDKFKDQRQNNFTLAPEAASDQLRNIINKPISTDDVLDTVIEIFAHGWTNIKLYFMIGLPGETIEDVEAIITLAKTILSEGRRSLGNRVRINLGVGTFVPKAHTPFQWASLETRENIRSKQDILKREARKLGIKISWTNPENSMLESFLSRGDRRIADVILTAWENGAKFDAWDEYFKFEVWMNAFARHGLDPAFFTSRIRNIEEVFPWDHISILVKKTFLKREYERSLIGSLTDDCRNGCFSCGILPELSDLRQQFRGDIWQCPDVKPV